MQSMLLNCFERYLLKLLNIWDILKIKHSFNPKFVWVRVQSSRVMSKYAENRDVTIVINTADVPVKVIRNGPLIAVNEPVAWPIILVGELRCHLGCISILKWRQVLVMTLRSIVNNNWRITLIANANQELAI